MMVQNAENGVLEVVRAEAAVNVMGNVTIRQSAYNFLFNFK